mmetsp:Transcript_113009/g.314483  ORF Transcript_113009/g.314483 Transcript_113009/m.314483 type:complete len:265 (+) Transcript_113009:1034-1828(+)
MHLFLQLPLQPQLAGILLLPRSGQHILGEYASDRVQQCNVCHNDESDVENGQPGACLQCGPRNVWPTLKRHELEEREQRAGQASEPLLNVRVVLESIVYLYEPCEHHGENVKHEDNKDHRPKHGAHGAPQRVHQQHQLVREAEEPQNPEDAQHAEEPYHAKEHERTQLDILLDNWQEPDIHDAGEHQEGVEHIPGVPEPSPAQRDEPQDHFHKKDQCENGVGQEPPEAEFVSITVVCFDHNDGSIDQDGASEDDLKAVRTNPRK